MLQAHNSYITHLDWSKDSTYLQTNSGDYELLFCENVFSSFRTIEGGKCFISLFLSMQGTPPSAARSRTPPSSETSSGRRRRACLASPPSASGPRRSTGPTSTPAPGPGQEGSSPPETTLERSSCTGTRHASQR